MICCIIPYVRSNNCRGKKNFAITGLKAKLIQAAMMTASAEVAATAASVLKSRKEIYLVLSLPQIPVNLRNFLTTLGQSIKVCPSKIILAHELCQ